MNFQILADDLVASAFRLSTQAGWNQTEDDWRRLMRLNPERARVWRYSGKGLGKATLAAALEQPLQLPILGLDATHLREPLYRKAGFKSISPIVRWEGVISAAVRDQQRAH